MAGGLEGDMFIGPKAEVHIFSGSIVYNSLYSHEGLFFHCYKKIWSRLLKCIRHPRLGGVRISVLGGKWPYHLTINKGLVVLGTNIRSFFFFRNTEDCLTSSILSRCVTTCFLYSRYIIMFNDFEPEPGF